MKSSLKTGSLFTVLQERRFIKFRGITDFPSSALMNREIAILYRKSGLRGTGIAEIS